MAEQQAVKETMAQYFHAQYTYDADALKSCCNPPGTEVSKMLLMHLAATRHIGMTIATHATDDLHLQSGLAVPDPAVTVADQSE